MLERTRKRIGASRLAVVVIGLAVFSLCQAEEHATTLSDSERARRLIEDTTVAPTNFRYQSVLSTLSAASWQTGPLDGVEFSDGDTLSRLTKVRFLSLLTVAEFRQSRLFFGVNDSGIVGVHLTGSSKGQRERFLELARMPHLE